MNERSKGRNDYLCPRIVQHHPRGSSMKDKATHQAITDYRIPQIFEFLREIASHNERSWFQDHRDAYDEAREDFERLAADLIARLAQMDASLSHLTVKDCTYRFYRDTRFSQDKSPYKRHFGCYVAAMGKKSYHGGYYLHLEPGSCLVAGGCYCLPTNILAKVRQTILYRTDEFREMVENERFKSLYLSVTFDPMKAMPRGVPRDYPYPQYMKCRNYCVEHSLDDDFFAQPDWMEHVMEMFGVMRPFVDFVNDTVDDYI